ncbi:apolipoprotein N-acyltransferase [Mucilaginibacter achroorhodeus]|uniref:Apolipoprotein N-acyltransferase n=1 Tax=Mucilaginibacter achroorhodeus TaxID=2599294 RepID=A0A563U058_9SPHI|nr:apolipoprotein N-acyltransferase [Mucilaginibacter achroorhodeus]TWR25014.1 apolipoprotein N-acyltransferase [Mucilaginibacter achroorhodeus]
MKKNILLSIFSGLLLWVAWPPTHYTTIMLLIGFVPMLVAVENIIKSDVKSKGKKIFHIAFLGFFVWNVLCIYWVYNALKIIGPVTAIPITLIPYSLGPVLMATACWLYYRLRLKANRTISLVGLVCFWIGYEYLHQSWDLNFPWMTLGNGLATTHQWAQWYEYTGVYGGTIWIWAINILVFLIYIGLRESQAKTIRLKLIVSLVLVFILPLSFSLYTYYQYQEVPNPSNIVVAQPNIDPYEKEGTVPSAEQINILTKLCDSIGQRNTEYFIWPETAIVKDMDEDRIRTEQPYLQVKRFLERFKNGNVITGGETHKFYVNRATGTASPLEDGSAFYDRFSAAINIENSDKVQFYHKSRLVPGAESLPFGNALSFIKPVFEHLGGATGAYGMQSEPSVLYSQSGIGATPVICYESLWGEWVAKSVRQGSQFIAVITNDGWWGNTSGKDQHLDYAKLRAIENRRWVCQSANTGISAFINGRGDIVQQSKWWVRTALKQDINLNNSLTFYTEHGDYLPKTGSALAVLGMIFLLIRIKRNSRDAK